MPDVSTCPGIETRTHARTKKQKGSKLLAQTLLQKGVRVRRGGDGKVARGEGLDDARDLLALAGEAERREVPAQRVAELHVGEVEGVGEFREGLEVQVVGLAEVESDGGLVEAGAGAEERADADGLEDLGEQPEALAELEALGRLAVELLRAHGQPLLALLREPQLLDRVRRLLRGQLLLVRLRLVVVQLRGLVAPARVRQRPQDRKQPLQRQQIQRVQRPRQRERVLRSEDRVSVWTWPLFGGDGGLFWAGELLAGPVATGGVFASVGRRIPC
eukprot:1579896-Rhodomonas_salina.1